MENRRTFLAMAAALFPAGLVTLAAQTQATSGPSELARHTLSGPFDGLDAILLELHPGPGAGRDHRHTGPVLGYVLEGKVRFGVDHGDGNASGPVDASDRRSSGGADALRTGVNLRR